MSVLFLISGCGGGGGGDSPANNIAANPTPITNPTPPPSNVIAAPIVLTAENSNAPSATYQGAKRPIVTNLAVDINGVAGVQINVSSLSGNFYIQCRKGSAPVYFYSTPNVTTDGIIQYRVGTQLTKTEKWIEGSDFRTLFSPIFDIGLIKSMYQNLELRFQWNRFSGGSVLDTLNLNGFPIAIDETRGFCGWDSVVFPVDNGWGQAMPNVPPLDARVAEFVDGSIKEYRTIAWKAKNASGKDQLLVRVGDRAGEGPCAAGIGGLVGTMGGDRFYVRQNGVIEPAVSGSNETYSCIHPRFMALQGKFDINQPFTLEIYSFYSSSLEPEKPSSLNQKQGPFAKVSF